MAKAKFDIKTEAQKGLHAGVGAADLAIEAVKDYAVEAQERFEGYRKDAQKALSSAQQSVRGFDFEPQALRTQATTIVSARVEELSKDAKARREAIEKRVAELQDDAQKLVVGGVATATGTFESLVERGERVVKRLRKETASTVDPGPVKKDTGVTTTAKKTPVKKTPVRKTTVKRATAKKAPAKKATASN